MSEPQEFAVLMQRLNEGSPDAARELFDRYGPHILRVVRRRLDQKLRSKFDSLDFVQDVWTSFFADRASRRTFDRPEALIAYLANMACHKVIDAFRARVQAKKNDLNRERSLESVAAQPNARLVARHPTPSQVAMAQERWNGLLRGRPRRHQAILRLLRQGNSHREIARQLGINEKTVRRVLQQISPETTA